MKSVPPLLLQLLQLLLRTCTANRLNKDEGELLLDVLRQGQLVCHDITVPSYTVGGQVTRLVPFPYVGFMIGPSLLWIGCSAHIQKTTLTGDCIYHIDRIAVDWVWDGVASSW